MNFELKGVVPALITTFSDGEFSPEHFEKNIKRYIVFDISGILVLGSTGESILLNERERLSVVETAMKSAGDDTFVIVGTGMQSAAATIDFTNKAAEFDPFAALVVTPFYYKGLMTHQALRDYFYKVADNSKIPVMVYNVPKYTGLQIQIDTIAELSLHENIIGIKDSSGNMEFFEQLVKLRSDSFRVMQGAGSMFYPSIVMGCDGGILALADIAPAEVVKMYISAKEGMHDKARDIQFTLLEVNKRIVGGFGVPGIKYAVDQVGFYGGEPRSPLTEVDMTVKSEIISILKNADLIA
ncbi:dihydrodipicolinate synthase family protein [candidate division KSB1 bacterium]